MSEGNGLQPTSQRTPQTIIDQAIAENNGGAALCYLLIIVFVASGLFVLAWGVWRDQGMISLAGAVTSGLFWPALSHAQKIREKNMAIRLLELTVSGTRDARQTAALLRDVYRDLFSGRRK